MKWLLLLTLVAWLPVNLSGDANANQAEQSLLSDEAISSALLPLSETESQQDTNDPDTDSSVLGNTVDTLLVAIEKALRQSFLSVFSVYRTAYSIRAPPSS